ncbi:tetratricopeptide repeat protein [Riemerella anatipestifer]|nr:tetratricopeptide repeat protein [Riemerella anatipestifer]
MIGDNKKENLLISNGSTGLVRVKNSISILNKILYGSISDLFNEAFRKMNSMHNLSTDIDYLYLIETNPVYRKNKKYKYLANDDDYREALLIFTDVLKIKPKHVLSIDMRAICKVKLGNASEAIEDYSKAIEIDPNYAFAYSNRGKVKVYLKDYQGAIEDYSKVIEIEPNNAFAYSNRGEVKVYLKDYQGAIEDYSKAIEIDPSNSNFYRDRGEAKLMLDRYGIDGLIEDIIKADNIDTNGSKSI